MKKFIFAAVIFVLLLVLLGKLRQKALPTGSSPEPKQVIPSASESLLSGTTDVYSSSSALRPQWSPDGKWILFDQLEQGTPYKSDKYKIYRIHPDGTGLECLTCGQTEVPASSGGAAMDPSGRFVVFSAEQASHYQLKGSAADPGGGIFNDVSIFDLVTNKITRVYVVGSGLNGQGAGGSLFPRFSRSGKKIAWSDYVNTGSNKNKFGPFRIIVPAFLSTP